MKKFYFLSFFTLLCFFSRAQVTVTATAGTTGPSIYTTVHDAVLAISNGVHQGDIVLTVTANTTESSSAIFVQSGVGAASYSSIILRPAAGVAATVTGDIAGALFDFSGADNITVDGLNSVGSSLVLSNTNISASANCLRFTDGASNNIVQNCSLLGANPSNTSGTVFFGTTVATGNSNNQLIANRIADASTGTPAVAIYSLGSAGQENNNNIISGNLVYNYFQAALATAGILVAANNARWTIGNNHFYQTTARVFTAGFIHRAIQISGGDGHKINGNFIGGSDETGAGLYDLSGSSTRFTGIELSAGVVITSSIQGNIVQNIQVATTSGAGAPQGIFAGIYITAGNVEVGTTQGNIIGALTGNGSIKLMPSTGGSAVTGITYNSSGIIDIRNNTVGSIDLLPTLALSGNAFAVQIVGTGATITIQNNILGGSSANSIRVGVKGTTTGNGIIRGIFTNNNGTMNISNNQVQNLTHNSNNALALFRAIECQVGTVSITKNSISNIAAEGTSVSTATHEGIGILVSTGVANIVIDSNTISNLALTNSSAIGTIVSGIYISSNNTGVRITRNRLFGFSNAATGVSTTAPPVAAAIYLRDVVSGEIFVVNNMIALGQAQTTNTSFIGIWNQVNPVVVYTERIYYNSINIDGTAGTGAQPSFGYYRGNFSITFTGPVMDIKNNIIINARSGGTGQHYAIANSYGATSSASGWAASASDYNVLNANAATVGYWGGSQNFANWKLSSLGDNNSLNAVAVTFANPAADLHLLPGSNAAVEGMATPVATVTTDFDNQARDALLPDLGADELLSVVPIRIEFFRGRKEVGRNLLEWKGNSSSGRLIFIIERSSDGRSFAAAGSMEASSFNQVFSFYDLQPVAGINYYRLKTVEQDGNFYYSAIIALASAGKDMDISIRPNIVSEGMVNMYIQSSNTTQLTANVVDASGKIMMKKILNIHAGTTSYPVQLPELAKGLYYMTVSGNGQLYTQQIIVR